MHIMRALTFGLWMGFLAPGELLAQAFGEYGRVLGGVGQRQGAHRMVKAATSLRACEMLEIVLSHLDWLLHQDRLCSTRGRTMRQKK